jgi:SAM-dependent methyltransferase
MSDTAELDDRYSAIEDKFQEAMDESLNPISPDVLYDFVESFGLEPGAQAIEVGCGLGKHIFRLAGQFEFNVIGVDPDPVQLDAARRKLSRLSETTPDLADSVAFRHGWVEELPIEDVSVDLVWCRDVLSLVVNQAKAYTEFHRVMKPGGRAMVYQMFATDRLAPNEAWLLETMGNTSESMNPARTESVIVAAGLQIDECIEIGTSWGEYDEEHTGKGGRSLIHAARLLHDPDRYIELFGEENYTIALGDAFWHVYRMIGKLSGRAYLLSKP